MKPVPFEYARPRNLAEATALLAGRDAVALAGGQTLVPMLNMRLARPRLVVDLAHIPELDGIEDRGDHLWIGAMTRQADAASSPLVAARAPLLARALAHVGHAPTRARGTMGGTVANADPAAEVPLALTVIGGEVDLAWPQGTRSDPVRNFITGPMTTVLWPGAMVTGLQVPDWAGLIGTGFAEIAARRSDYAIVAAAAQIAIAADGRCIRASAAIGGAVDRPTPVDLAPLAGSAPGDAAIAACAGAAAGALDIRPPPNTSEAYCRRIAESLLRQCLTDARDTVS